MPICTIQYYGASETESRNLPAECAPDEMTIKNISVFLRAIAQLLPGGRSLRYVPQRHTISKKKKPTSIAGGSSYAAQRAYPNRGA